MNMEEERNKKKYKRLNLLFSLVGAVGSIFIAVSVTLIIYGFCFYAISNVGFLFLIATTNLNKEQLPMWIINSIITGIGILNYSGVI